MPGCPFGRLAQKDVLEPDVEEVDVLGAAGLPDEVAAEYPESNPVMISVLSLWDYRDVGGMT